MTETTLSDAQRERALSALAEITPLDKVGAFLRRENHDDGAYTLHFASDLLGYVGWEWTVSMAELAPGEVSILEAELSPTDASLIAPDWVPWSQRLAEYLEMQKQAGIDEAAALAQVQAEIEAETGVDPFDDDDEDDDESDEDESDDDESDEDIESEDSDEDELNEDSLDESDD